MILDGKPIYSPYSTPNIDDYYFDHETADLYCGFIEDCFPMYKSSFSTKANEYLKLLDWQLPIIRNLFGWKRKSDNCRRYTEALIYIPKKNGKTTLIGAIVTAFMKLEEDGGLECACGANSKEQAHLISSGVIQAIEFDTYLRSYFKIYKSTKRITANGDADTFFPVSADAKLQDGLNLNLVLLDEIHEFVNDVLAETLKKNQSARKQPLFIEITTASTQGVNYCNDRLDYAQKVVRGEWEADHFLPVLFYLDKDEDWTDEENWARVNPSLGMTKNPLTMKREFVDAKRQPAKENDFKRKELNMMTTAKSKFIDLDFWKVLQVERPELEGALCYAGLDMAYKDDMCSLVLEFPNFNNFILPFFWIPEEHEQIEKYERFNEHITRTEGNAIDFRRVREDIAAIAETFRVAELAFDPRYATELCQTLNTDHGIETIEFNQGGIGMSEAVNGLSAGVKAGQFSHDGNPVMTWMVGNAEVKEDRNNCRKFVKPTGANWTVNKIDGCVAWAMAHARRIFNLGDDVWEDRLDKGESFF